GHLDDLEHVRAAVAAHLHCSHGVAPRLSSARSSIQRSTICLRARPTRSGRREGRRSLATMEPRTLGGRLTVGEIGLGCMGMSDFYGPSDDEQSLRVLDRALDLGVTLYDTSDMYGV